MFVRTKKAPSDVAGVIGSGLCIDADVCFSGVLRVEGTVRGKVSALPGQSGTLIVGKGGRVDGEVAVPHLVVHGTVNGVITRCDKLELAPSARVSGHLYYASISVSPGAILEGQLASRVSIAETQTTSLEPPLAVARL